MDLQKLLLLYEKFVWTIISLFIIALFSPQTSNLICFLWTDWLKLINWQVISFMIIGLFRTLSITLLLKKKKHSGLYTYQSSSSCVSQILSNFTCMSTVNCIVVNKPNVDSLMLMHNRLGHTSISKLKHTFGCKTST